MVRFISLLIAIASLFSCTTLAQTSKEQPPIKDKLSFYLDYEGLKEPEGLKVRIIPWKKQSKAEYSLKKEGKRYHAEINRGEYFIYASALGYKEAQLYVYTRRKNKYLRLSLKPIAYQLKGKIYNYQGYKLQGDIRITDKKLSKKELFPGTFVDNPFGQIVKFEGGDVRDSNYDLTLAKGSPVEEGKPYHLIFNSSAHKKSIYLDTVYFSSQNRIVTKNCSISQVLPKPIKIVKSNKVLKDYDGIIPWRGSDHQGFTAYVDKEEKMEIIRTLSKPVVHEVEFEVVNENGELLQARAFKHLYSGSDYVRWIDEETYDDTLKFTYIHPGEIEFEIIGPKGYKSKLVTLPNEKKIKKKVVLRKALN